MAICAKYNYIGFEQTFTFEMEKFMSDKKTGASILGQIIGWSILFFAVLGVILWYFARPALEERGYSVDEIKAKTGQIRENVNTTVDSTKEKFHRLKSKTGETSEFATEKAVEIKDKTAETSKVVFEEINLD